MVVFKRLKKIFDDIGRFYPLLFTLAFIIILIQYSFSSLEMMFYDFRVKYDFGISYKSNVVIVTLDEESDQFLGETYPYSFATHNRFIKNLLRDNPRNVSYLIDFSSVDEKKEKNFLNDFFKQIDEYYSRSGFFQFQDVSVGGEGAFPKQFRNYPSSKEVLSINKEQKSRSDIVRRATLNISGENTLDLEAVNHFRISSGKPPLELHKIKGAVYDRETDTTSTLFRYSTDPRNGKSKITNVPYHKVVVGNYPVGLFTNKIVLVGPTYLSNPNDFVYTPFDSNDEKVSKLLTHGLMVESLIQGKTIVRVPRKITNVLVVFFAIILVLIISRVRPAVGLLVTTLTMVGIFVLSILLFSLFGVWLYISHLFLTVFVVYYIWFPFKAITEYQRRFAIQEETKILKQVDRLKRNFLSLMSHDLKTPVAKIAGIADVLSYKFDICEDQRRHLNNIVQATKDLNKFITSILDLTKIESKKISLNLTSKDVNQVINPVLKNLEFEAADKKIKIVKELSPLYPIKIDIELLKRVVSNLVENAIKYSQASEVEIKSWDDDKWVYITVKDNGIGIAKNESANIFEKFYRISNDASHQTKGSGLGLYLVKYFIELHEGTIKVDSTPGAGTTFQVRLKNV